MRILRHFTSDRDVYAGIEFVSRRSVIHGRDGTILYDITLMAPEDWSQIAVNMLAEKYLRKAQVPSITEIVAESGVPEWLSRSVPAGGATFGPETDARAVFHRIAGAWTYWGWKLGYFDSEEDAVVFYDEIRDMLARQMMAPNSPQWFNCFSGREKLITKEHGSVALSEVSGTPVTVWTRQGWKSAEVKSFGKQNIRRVTLAPAFRGGGDYRPGWNIGKTTVRVVVETTANHRWIMADGGETTSLAVGDVVPASVTDGSTTSDDYRAGFRHGVVFGDGSVAYRHKTSDKIRYRVRLCGQKSNLAWAFDTVNYPDCFGGEPLVQVVSSEDLKDFPAGKSVEYISGFLNGWIATDGTDRPAAVRLSSNRADARDWLDENAACAGWVLTGHSIEEIAEVKFGDKIYQQTNPQHAFTLSKAERAWKVVSIEENVAEETVYCAVVPGVGEFTLASGIVTGNCGLNWAYGIAGTDRGMWAIKPDQSGVEPAPDTHTRPGAGACFISSIEDKLFGDSSITDFITRETRIFAAGAGSGANYSEIRGDREPLSGGGRSSGLLSFLKPIDSMAGSIKSGGANRRAARMVVIDMDHPDIEEFVDWKMLEEKKVAAMVTGYAILKKHVQAVHAAYSGADAAKGKAAVAAGVAAGVPYNTLLEARLAAEGGEPCPEIPLLDTDYEGAAYRTITGQNANNSVRVTDDFMVRVESGAEWPLYHRTELRKAVAEGREPVPSKTLVAKELWDKVARAAHACADPGVQFHDAVNDWHTCREDGDIRATNPCSEFNWLDNSTCNLACLNLVTLIARRVDGSIDWPRTALNYRHAARLSTVALDITVSMAGYPSAAVADGGRLYRTIGLGYANLGALLMREGIPYDSDEARGWAVGLGGLIHYAATITSASLARDLGPFPRWEANRKHTDRVVRNHTAYTTNQVYDGLEFPPPDPTGWMEKAPKGLREAVTVAAVQAENTYFSADSRGLRNAQLTLCMPAGTVGLLMDCDCTGIEPDFALVKGKQLAGGGWMSIVNKSVHPALLKLGYTPAQADAVEAYVLAKGTVEGCPDLRPEHLPVFDCAVPCTKGGGVRSVSIDGHLLMLAAIQPLLSGSASKTINLPPDAAVADVRRVYTRAWKLRIKCVALYRDGSKLGQPLNAGADAVAAEPAPEPRPEPKAEPAAVDNRISALVSAAQAVRRRLPARRHGVTVKLKVMGHKMYVRTGEYEDGTLGEIFVNMSKDGTLVRSLMDAFAVAVSLGLQHGVPLDEFVDAFVFTRFEPNGPVSDHPHIKTCSSVIDLIFRELAISYLGRNDLAHVPPAAPAAPAAAPPPTPVVSVKETVTAVYANGTTKSQTFQPQYEGVPCRQCGQLKLVRNGTCLICVSCGTTTGCS